MKYFMLVLVAIGGFNTGLQSSALRYDLPVDGEWWKFFLSLFFTVMFGMYVLFGGKEV